MHDSLAMWKRHHTSVFVKVKGPQLRPFTGGCGVSRKCMILMRCDHLPMCSHVYDVKSTWATICVMRSHTTSVALQYDLTAIRGDHFIKQWEGNPPPPLRSTLYPIKYHDQILFAGVHLYTCTPAAQPSIRPPEVSLPSQIIFIQQPASNYIMYLLRHWFWKTSPM